MTNQLPPSLQRFGAAFEAAVRAELAHADRPEPGRAGRGALLRPRVLAGGTLGLAGVGAALVLALSAGGAAAPRAYAITKHSDGSLTVSLNADAGLVGVNRKLAAMGADEHIEFQMAQGPAAVSGPVNCVPTPQGASVSGPPVNLTVGAGVTNTETIAAGNTGAGTWHVATCSRSSGADPTGLRYLG
jgi:hypothetical protein